jgi:hypothetical protein
MLIECGDHRLRDVREEMIDAEACPWKGIYPVVKQQTAYDEFEKKVGQISGTHGMMMKAKRHGTGVPIDDHVHEGEEGDAAQLSPTQLSQSAAVLCREVRQVVGELV